MVTFDELDRADFAHLRTQAADWHKAVSEIDRVATDFQRDVRAVTVRAGWHGFVANMADGDIDLIGRQLLATRLEFVAVAEAIDGVVDDLSRIQASLHQVLHEAQAAGYTVAWNGGILITSPEPADGVLSEADTARVTAAMDGYRRRIEDLVRNASDTDARYAGILAAIRPDEVRASDPHSAANAAADVRAATGMPGDPAAVRTWWLLMDPVTRAQMYAADPTALVQAGIFAPPPWHPADGGAGAYDARNPGAGDYAFEALAETAAAAAPWVGLPHAGENLQHYLDGSGKPLNIDVDQMMRDAPTYAKAVEARLLAANDAEWRAQALDAFAASGGAPVTIPVQTKWEGLTVGEGDSKDWFRAVGSNMTQVSGVVTVGPGADGKPKITMEYQVNVADRYNWDAGKATQFGPVTIRDSQMADLHQTGLAQEYDLHGASSTQTRTLGDGSGFTPSGGPRDNTREDPDRGSVDGRNYR